MNTFSRLLCGALGALALVMATSAFQCASSEMTTAKLEISRKEYVKARASLEAELKKNPKNEEAWLLLARTTSQLKDYHAMNEAGAQVLTFGNKFQNEVVALRYQAWLATYNEGVRLYNEGENGNMDKLRDAYNALTLATELDKEEVDVYTLLASTALQMGDTARAVSNYEYYIGLTEANAMAGANMGLTLGAKQPQVVQALGAPARKRFIPLGNDSVFVYVYPNHDGHAVSVFFTHEKVGDYAVDGWYVVPPAKPNADSMREVQVRTVAYRTLGILSYNKGLGFLKQLEESPKHDSTYYRSAVKELDRTIGYLSKAQRIDPSDEYSASVLSDCYLKTNKIEIARSSYEKLIKEFPRNKSNRMNYGLLLMNLEDYEGAIKQFKEAVDIDPRNEGALFDLGAAYKNWAVAEQAKTPKGKEAKGVGEKLLKAEEYFERVIELSPANVDVLSQLVEIYGALKKKEKVQSLLAPLEIAALSNADDVRVWEALGGVYTRLGNTKKAQEAYQKADALRKK